MGALAHVSTSETPWTWHVHPDVWLLVVVLEAGYLLALARLGPGHAPRGERAATRRQVVLYSLGVLAIWAGADWPLHDLAEGYLFTAHMVQHLLFSLVAAPLLLLGLPPWLVRLALRPRLLRRLAKVITRPLVALVIFNGVIVVTHWPYFVDLTLRSEIAHFLAHALLVAAAILMWWPVLSPLPELPRLSRPGSMLYLFLQSIVPTVPASFLTFGSVPLYPFYETVPRLWGLEALTDMRIAGLTMKLLGGLILWVVIAGLFFRWWEEEQRTEGWDALGWQDVERDVRAGLSER